MWNLNYDEYHAMEKDPLLNALQKFLNAMWKECSHGEYRDHICDPDNVDHQLEGMEYWSNHNKMMDTTDECEEGLGEAIKKYLKEHNLINDEDKKGE